MLKILGKRLVEEKEKGRKKMGQKKEGQGKKRRKGTENERLMKN